MAKRYVRKKKRRNARPGRWALLIALLALIVVLAVVLSRSGREETPAQGDGLWDGSWYEDDLGRIQSDRALVKGMKAEEAIERLRGIRCGFKSTSCPDQLAKGLEKALAK